MPEATEVPERGYRNRTYIVRGKHGLIRDSCRGCRSRGYGKEDVSKGSGAIGEGRR